MPEFNNEEYADMVFVYGRADGNSRAAQRMYRESYPDRRVPHHTTFTNTFRRLRETGTLHFREPRQNNRQHRVVVDENILQEFDADPTTSVRKVARNLGVSSYKVWTVINADRRYPYHYTPVQGLVEGDQERRSQFCRFLLHTDVDNEDFLKNILWTDESKFTREGIFNQHNLHLWESQNPHATRVTSHQYKFSVNVWAGVIGKDVVGPHYLPDTLNGENYLEFLINDLPELMSHLPIFEDDRAIIFQNDGCPAHYRNIVREYLDDCFPNSWIGRRGPIEWPARSPDLTPLDFYVWGRAKELVYEVEITTKEELVARINDVFAKIKAEMTLNTTTKEIRRRCRACIRNRGAVFEQDLK